MKHNLKRVDPLTKEEFTAKRINQRFIKKDNRIKWNNNRSNSIRHQLSYINDLLRANYRILSELMKDKTEQTFNDQYLIGKDFSFKVHTHFIEHEGKRQTALYEYLIIPMNNQQTKIIKENKQ